MEKEMYHEKTMKEYFLKMFQGAEAWLFSILLFFAPIRGVLITVGAFILLDTISGIWKSRVRGIPITSRGLSGIISKMFLYELTVITTYILDFYILGDVLDNIFNVSQMLTKVVAMILVYIEAQSINENYKAAKGIDLWDQFKKLLSRTREITDDLKEVKDDIKDIKEIAKEIRETNGVEKE